MIRVILLGTILLFGIYVLAQPPFYFEIKAFKKQDSAHFPPPNQILFVGSSSFNNWKDVQSYFSGYPIINRGFGGSTLTDVIRYANDIIIPYHPKQIIIYCGENDLAYSKKTTPEMVLSRFKKLFYLIRKALPDVPIDYVSIKPSPDRISLMSKMKKTNQLLFNFLKSESNSYYIDVYTKMLDKNGQPKPDIFNPDQLHMNAKGYAIWKKEIQPFLKD